MIVYGTSDVTDVRGLSGLTHIEYALAIEFNDTLARGSVKEGAGLAIAVVDELTVTEGYLEALRDALATSG